MIAGLMTSVDVPEARDAEEQKTRNRSLAKGPQLLPGRVRVTAGKNGRANSAGVRV
jgi:hypothetical protein